MDKDKTGSDEEQAVMITSEMLADGCQNSGQNNFEENMSYFPLTTLSLLGINILIFFMEVFNGALDSINPILQIGALYRPAVLAGDIWRPLTCIFLHGSFDHLVGNGIMLYILGIACEHAFGTKHMVKIFLVSGLAGSLLSLIMGPGPSVGASGAIFGLAATMAAFFYKHQDKFSPRDKRIGIVVGVWAAYAIFNGFFTPYVDNFAHLGGFIGGGWFVLKPLNSRS